MRTSRHRWFMLPVVMLLAVVVGCSSATAEKKDAGSASGAVSVKTNKGVVTLDAPPKRIVVLDLTVLDIIDSLGFGDRVALASGSQGAAPAFLKKYKILKGGQRNIDVEGIAAAEPDLIIGGPRNIGQKPELASSLGAITTTIDLGPDFRNFSIAENRDLVERVAAMFGDKAVAVAKTKLDDIDKRVAKMKKNVPDAERKALSVMVTGGQVNVFGPGSRWGIMFTDLGYTPVGGTDSTTYNEPISFEFIANANPATLFVLDRDAAIGQEGKSAAATLDNQLVNGTQAVKDGRVINLDPASWLIVNGGINGMNAMLDDLAKK